MPVPLHVTWSVRGRAIEKNIARDISGLKVRSGGGGDGRSSYTPSGTWRRSSLHRPQLRNFGNRRRQSSRAVHSKTGARSRGGLRSTHRAVALGKSSRPSSSAFSSFARRPRPLQGRAMRGTRFKTPISSPSDTWSLTSTNLPSIIPEAPSAPRSHAAQKSSHEVTPDAWPFSPRPTTNI